MIISCPSCYTRYLVDPISIGHDGRDVRCAKCQHTWFQAPKASPATASEPAFIDKFLGTTPTAQAQTASSAQAEAEYAGNAHEIDELLNTKPDYTPAATQQQQGFIDDFLQTKPDTQDPGFIDDFLSQPQADESEATDEEDSGPAPIIGEIPSMEDLERLESLPQTRGLPAVIAARTPGWIKAGFFTLLLCVLGTGFIAYNATLVKIIPAFEPVYSALGFYPTDGVTLADLSVTKLSSGRKDRYALKCAILNTTDQERRVPRIDVSLLSLEGYTIAGYNDVMSERKLLAPGKSIPCGKLVLELDSLSKHARKVLIDMGNSYELMLR